MATLDGCGTATISELFLVRDQPNQRIGDLQRTVVWSFGLLAGLLLILFATLLGVILSGPG